MCEEKVEREKKEIVQMKCDVKILLDPFSFIHSCSCTLGGYIQKHYRSAHVTHLLTVKLET